MRRLLLVLALLTAACATAADTTTTVAPPTTPGSSTTIAPVTTVAETTTTVAETTTTTIPLAEPTWDSWTLIMASVPNGDGAEDEALALAHELPGSGVLLSDDYPSLNPGYWVVFWGSWANQPSTGECPEANDAYTCYARFLGESQGAPAIALVGQDLVEIDTGDGSIIRTIKTDFGDAGVFRSGFSLTPDRQFLYYSEGWEDSWYSCEASPGSVGRINLATGAIEDLWIGSGVITSPDGNFVAYLESTQCLPDPEAPDIWVLTPYDQVVVVDLRFNEPASMSTQTMPTSYTDTNALRWVGFHPDGEALVLTEGDTLYKVPLGAAAAIQTHPYLLTGVTGYPVGVAGNSLLTVEWNGGEGDASEIELKAYDLTTGGITYLFTNETWLQVGVDSMGGIIVSFEDWMYPLLDNPVSAGNFISSIDW